MMRARGMTLLEMMVALFIVAIMMSFLIPIYIRTMKVKSRTEKIAMLTARGRGTMAILRRDIGGAFRTAVAMYDFGGAHSSGAEFHWEAPVDTTPPIDPAEGFRRLTFISAVDGSRVNGDPMRDYDYARVSWALKGTLQRMVTPISISKIVPEGSAWTPGFDGGVLLTSAGGEFDDAGAFRGAPYLAASALPAPASSIQLHGQLLRGRLTFSSVVPTVDGFGTKFLTDIDANDYIMGGRDGVWTRVTSVETDIFLTLATPYVRDDSNTVGLLKKPISVTATVCWPDAVTSVPDWLESDWKLIVGSVEKGSVPYNLYTRFCPTGGVPVGANTSSPPFFVIVEPGWWSMGEEAEDLVFYPPASYVGATPPPDTDGDGTWEDGEGLVAADGIWTSGVPTYVDVRLRISDPEYKPGQLLAGVRTFSERVAIPAGVLP